MIVHRRFITLVAALGAAAAASACSSSGGSAPSVNLPTQAASDAAGVIGLSTAGVVASPPMRASDVRIRVVNVYEPKGRPAPALDIYDVQLTGQKATPVATNLANGAVSPYFTPHEATTSVGHPAVQLYALPAGEDPIAHKDDAKSIGAVVDDGSHAQVTFLLTADHQDDNLPGPLSGLSNSQRIEKGDDGQGGKGPVAPPTPSGQGELLVDTAAIFDLNLSTYLMIDDSCTPPTNGDPNVKDAPLIFAVQGGASYFALFPTTPGTHQISVVSFPAGRPPTCGELTAKQAMTSADVTAGQQIEVYLYGTSASDLHMILAPIGV